MDVEKTGLQNVVTACRSRGVHRVVYVTSLGIAITLGGNRPRMRTIAPDDLIAYLAGVLDDPCAYQQRHNVGNDDVW